MTAGLRNMGGTDYFVYENDYTGLRPYDGNGMKAMFEIGYTSLVFISNSLHLTYNEFILIYSFIALFLLFKFYKRKSALPFLSLLLYLSTYYMYYNMIAIRQMLPMALMLYVVYFLSKRKYVYLFLFLLLGTLFHSSFLIVLLVIPFLIFFKPNGRNLLILLFCSVIIKGVVFPAIEFALNYFDTAIALRMGELSSNDEDFSVVYYLKTFVIAFFLISNRDKLNTRFMCLLFNCYLLSLLLPFCFTGNKMVFRLSAYFDLSITLLIPYLICNVKYSTQTRRMLYILISTLSIFLFYRNLLMHDNGSFFDYNFYFL